MTKRFRRSSPALSDGRSASSAASLCLRSPRSSGVIWRNVSSLIMALRSQRLRNRTFPVSDDDSAVRPASDGRSFSTLGCRPVLPAGRCAGALAGPGWREARTGHQAEACGMDDQHTRGDRQIMGDRQAMRASDHDRQAVVDLLRGAVEDGRLQMDEYVDRMGRAYQAVTYGDLVPLYADLPAAGPASKPAAGPGSCRAAAFAGLPAVLRVLWTIWLSAVSINVVDRKSTRLNSSH